MPQPEISALPGAASMANVLESAVGPRGSVLVRLGLMVPIAGAFMSRNLFAIENPHRAAHEGLLSENFALENQNGFPSGSRWLTVFSFIYSSA